MLGLHNLALRIQFFPVRFSPGRSPRAPAPALLDPRSIRATRLDGGLDQGGSVSRRLSPPAAYAPPLASCLFAGGRALCSVSWHRDAPTRTVSGVGHTLSLHNQCLKTRTTQ